MLFIYLFFWFTSFLESDIDEKKIPSKGQNEKFELKTLFLIQIKLSRGKKMFVRVYFFLIYMLFYYRHHLKSGCLNP